MSERIDILSTPKNMGAKFTVDHTVSSVDLVQCVPGAPQTMVAGGGTILGGGYEFENGDNFHILSAGYHIPERFVMSQYEFGGGGEFTLPVMVLRGSVTGGAGPYLPLTQFGNNGSLRLPFENSEISIGTFVDVIELGLVGGGGTFTIECLFPFTIGADSPQVSMINVPADFADGTVIYVTPFVKVLHNFALS